MCAFQTTGNATATAELIFTGGIEHLPASALKLLEGAVRAIGGRGLSELSIERVCRISRVSRATLYRYFSNKDDLLEAVGEFICRGFETGIAEEAASYDDPADRFAAVMSFLARYTTERGLVRIFETDPSFHLVFLRSHFARHRAAVENALDPVFEWIEKRDAIAVDRAVSAERLVRLQLSRLLVPFDNAWGESWQRAVDCAPETILSWIVIQPAR
jgi:AcrR family transcriptional regulator